MGYGPKMDAELDVALEAARNGGRIALEHAARGVRAEWKGAGDLVTAADRAVQEAISSGISAAFPSDIIVGEEGDPPPEEAVRGARRWYVDPIDGTSNYLKGRRWWGVSIAYCDADDRIAAGVVHLPALGETFAGARGAGATRNGEPIRCSPVVDLAEALCCSGFPGAESMRAASEHNLGPWGRVMRRALSMRATGAVAPDWCAVAAGLADGSWTLGGGRWDLAAGTIIAREAGATVTDLDGIALYGPGTAGIVATPGIHAELLALVNDVPVES